MNMSSMLDPAIDCFSAYGIQLFGSNTFFLTWCHQLLSHLNISHRNEIKTVETMVTRSGEVDDHRLLAISHAYAFAEWQAVFHSNSRQQSNNILVREIGKMGRIQVSRDACESVTRIR